MARDSNASPAQRIKMQESFVLPVQLTSDVRDKRQVITLAPLSISRPLLRLGFVLAAPRVLDIRVTHAR